MNDLRERLEELLLWYERWGYPAHHIATLREVLAKPERLLGEPFGYVSADALTDFKIGRTHVITSQYATCNTDVPLYAPPEVKP